MSRVGRIRIAMVWLVLLTTPLVLTQNAASNSPVDFVDRAREAGLTAENVFGRGDRKDYIIESTGTGVAIFDYDNDGWPDIFVVNGTTLTPTRGQQPTNHLYHNNHDGTFTDVTVRAGLAGASGWGQGVCVGDIDNDGWPDLFVTSFGENRLYRNRRDGTFEEIAKLAGVAGEGTWSTGCTFIDYDRDGKLDLFVATYAGLDRQKLPEPGSAPTCQWKGLAVFCGPRGLPADINHLYHNRGDGTFEEVTKAAKITQTLGHYCFATTTLDFDNDGWPDIYVACDSTPSILYRNNHDGTFTDVAVSAGVAYNEDGREQAGMGIAVGDYDGDGWLDLFRSNFSDDSSTLYRNNHDGTFTDTTVRTGLARNTRYLGWGAAFCDFDNDGWPDLIVANGHVYPEVDRLQLDITYREPKLVYRNRQGTAFRDISSSAGPGITSAASARGLAVGDLWNDGKMEVVVVNMNAAPSLLVNRVRTANHWIALRLVGVVSNAGAIGARVTLKTATRTLVDEVRSSSSYLSVNDQRLHFGLGPATEVAYADVRWPNGLVERFHRLLVDRFSTLREGTGERITEGSQPSR
jgi:enediyne biosynthesis protein E4